MAAPSRSQTTGARWHGTIKPPLGWPQGRDAHEQRTLGPPTAPLATTSFCRCTRCMATSMCRISMLRRLARSAPRESPDPAAIAAVPSSTACTVALGLTLGWWALPCGPRSKSAAAPLSSPITVPSTASLVCDCCLLRFGSEDRVPCESDW